MITIKISDDIYDAYEPEIHVSGQVSLGSIDRVIERLEYAKNVLEMFYIAKKKEDEVDEDTCPPEEEIQYAGDIYGYDDVD